MKLLNLTNKSVLSFLLLVPGALKAMDMTDSAKRHTWTRYFLERKHSNNLETNFFGADNHYDIDGQGNAKSYSRATLRWYNSRMNPVATNEESQADVSYSAQVTLVKAVLDDRKKISALEMQYSISKASGDQADEVLVAPTPVTVPATFGNCWEHVETIKIENLEPFDLYITTNIYDVNNN